MIDTRHAFGVSCANMLKEAVHESEPLAKEPMRHGFFFSGIPVELREKRYSDFFAQNEGQLET